MDTPKRKDPAAVSLGRKGGNARAAKLTPTRMLEIALKASEAARKAREAKKVSLIVRT